MKNYRILALVIAAIAVGFAFVGFQCSSAELTSAKLYMQRSEWNKAEEQLVKDVKINPKDEEGWYLLGRVRGETGNMEGMLVAFDSALAISKVHAADIFIVKAHYWVQSYNKGTKYLQGARDTNSYYSKAIDEFKQALLLEPDSTMGYKGLAYTYLNMGEPDSAAGPLMTLWTKNKDEEASRFLGEIYYEKGQKLKDAFENENGGKLDTLRNVLSIVKGLSEDDVVSTLGQPNEKKTEPAPKPKKRQEISSQASQKEVWTYKTYGLTLTFTDNVLTEKKVDFVYNPGIDSTKYEQALVQFKKALAILEPATKMYPNNSSLMTELTNCYISAGMTEQASAAFKEAAEKNPTNKDFQYNYGVILLRRNDYPNAITQFEKTLKIDSLYWNADYNLGASYVNWGVEIQNNASDSSDPDSVRKAVGGKFEKALPYLVRFSSHKPNDPNLWELLAKVYAYMNETQKAQDAIQKADSLRKGY